MRDGEMDKFYFLKGDESSTMKEEGWILEQWCHMKVIELLFSWRENEHHVVLPLS